MFLINLFTHHGFHTSKIANQEVHCISENYEQTDFLVVQNIQVFLSNEGYFDGSLNGYFDSKLEDSIKDFQTVMGIRIDGIIGPTTYKTMQKYDSCTKKSNTNFISCFNGDYKAYKACTSPYGSFTLEVPTLEVPTTTTTVPVDASNKIDCDDGGKMWHGDQGTLWNAQGVSITYENCDEHKVAKNQGYDYTEKPIPGVTPGVGFGNNVTTTTTVPDSCPSVAISNLDDAVSIAENQTSVITISATGTGSLTYSLSGTDSRLMSVNSSGVITLNSDADYDQKTSYSANAVVTDTVCSKTKAFTINVTDGSDKYVLDLLLIYHDDTIDDSSLNGYNADYDTASELLAFAQGQLETNQNARFTNSGITNLEFNVVGVHEWDVTYSAVEDDLLAGMVADQTLHKAKIRKGADIIGAFLPDEGASSYLYFDTTKNRQHLFKTFMLDDRYTNKYFPHELGHSMGICHSREQSTNPAETGDCSKDYAHAYAKTSGQTFSTLVGYGTAMCSIYSNPDLTCAGFPEVNTIGASLHYQNNGTVGSQAAGVENESDASRAIQEWAPEYERLHQSTNYGVSVGSTSIKSTAYFPLINGGSATYSYTEQSLISNTTNATKVMYVEKGSNVDVSGTTYETYYWCDTQNCDMNWVSPFDTGGDDHKYGILFYVNSGNYYIKTIGFSEQRGTYATTSSNTSLEVEFQNPCLFISHYMKTGQYNEADCASRFEDTWNYGSTYYDTWNFTNYVEKELVVTPYGAYDAYKIAHAQNSVGASNSSHRALQILTFWVNPEVGVLMFEDEYMKRWKLTALDTDGDGTGNGSDTDDDGDGVLDTADAFPLDPNASADADDDGIANGDE